MGGKILVIDDNEEIRAMFREYLESRRFQVIEAADGAQGFMLADAETPQLIIMDIVMSGVFGTSASQRLRDHRSTAGIPIVLISGSEKGPEMVRELTQHYPNIRFLKKPIDLGKLRELMDELVPSKESR